MRARYLVSAVCWAGAASAQPLLHLQDARLAPTAMGGTVALRAVVANPTSATVQITGISTPAARQVVFSQYTTTAQGIIAQQPLAFVTVPPHSELVFAPGATEARLLGLLQPLEAGLETPLTVMFAGGATRTMRVKITP